MKYLYVTWFLILPMVSLAQQKADTTIGFTIEKPKYNKADSPVLCIDAAHNNYHTAESGFEPFVKIVESDGYQVQSIDTPFLDYSVLNNCKILLISNALHQSNVQNWVLPTPSAFSPKEIEIIHQWVAGGGSLFLIADHMPFAGAAQELGKIFDFHFINGFATMEKAQNQPDIFSIQNGRLMESPVSRKGCVRDVTSFTSSAFSYPKEAMPVMVFIYGDFSLNPEIAWQFVEEIETVSLSGYAQGALLKYEKGRIAVFGEAAMFTAQIFQLPNGDEFKVGLNNKQLAPNNIRFG